MEFSAKVGELYEIPLHLHPSENFPHFKFVELIFLSPLLFTVFWGGHEALLEARVGIDDVAELPVKQAVESLSRVFVQPDTLNTVVSITPLHSRHLSLPRRYHICRDHSQGNSARSACWESAC